MSFNAEVKDELSRIDPEDLSSQRSELSALMHTEGTLSISGKGVYRIEVATETGCVARTIIKLAHLAYGLSTDLTVRKSVLHKTHSYLITIPPQPNLAEALAQLGILTERGIETGIAPDLVAEPHWAQAYLRGVFLGCGFIADPHGDFHFELTCNSERYALDVIEVMEDFGIRARYIQRRGNFTVYLKGAEAILTFLGITGAHQSALKMEDIRVMKSVRNDVNRRVNADLANQVKAIEAGAEQVHAIRVIERTCGIDSLSPALRDVCHLRLDNPDISLRELGELATPPLSKSAMGHRIRRIMEIAESWESCY